MAPPNQYSEALPHNGHWLLYINGLLIPCGSLSVTYGVGQIPTLSFNLPPSRLIQRLGRDDRLEVVVFFLDTLTDVNSPTYRLLFDGEISDWSYTNSTRGRQLSFNAVADFSILTQLHYFFLNNTDAAAQAVLNPTAYLSSIVQPGVQFPASLFKKGLVHTNEQDPADIERPYDIMYNVIKGVVSEELPAQFRSIPSINFFSRYIRKRNLVNKFVALPVFEDNPSDSTGLFPILEAAQQSEIIITALQNSLATTIGDAGNIYDVLREIYGKVFFEIAMLPTAPVVRVNRATGSIEATSSKDNSFRLMQYFVKPQCMFGIPPTCNVIFPSMHSRYQYSENYWTQPTRTYLNDQFYQNAVGAQNALSAASLTAAYPTEADVVLRGKLPEQAEDSVPNPILNGKNFLLFPEELFKGPVLSRATVPPWFSMLQAAMAAKKNSDNSLKGSFIDLFKTFAKYEHFRQRYEKRGGACDMVFNPFIVPGFPCVVFDQRVAALDTFGYVMSVTHTLSVGSMRTSMNYSYGRTFPEFIDLLKAERVVNPDLMSAPAEPTTTTRDISQKIDKAEEFYSGLFFSRLAPEGKTAAFDFTKTVGYQANSSEEVSTIDLSALSSDNGIGPLPSTEKLFTSHDAAMSHVSRPICSLEEYLTFIHGGVPTEELIVSKQVEDKKIGYGGAVYYSRIKRNTPVTTTTLMTPEQSGIKEVTTVEIDNPFIEPVSVAPQVEAISALPEEFPITAIDWDSILLAYRAEIAKKEPGV